MELPRHLWRFCTPGARNKLAERFGLPNEPGMQDWEYEVGTSERADEFLATYESRELSDDERFSLMEMIVQSLDHPIETEERSPRWLHALDLIEKNIELHIYSVCYWACLDCGENELDLAFYAAPDMRIILNRHAEQFGYPFPESEDEDSTS